MRPDDIDHSEEFARHLDAADLLRGFRERFLIPKRKDRGRDARATGARAAASSEVVYLAGNSLGLQPRTVRPILNEELDDWAELAVDAHFEARRPWYPYHEFLRASLARLVGAKEHEVVAMNSLTVNLHLMLVTFYRPTKGRFRILVESPRFPSDTYALQSHLHSRGLDWRSILIEARPRPGEHTVRIEDIESIFDMDGDSIALVLLGGVNFLTGQVFDLERITRAAHARGCVAGFDLAHGAGNIPLRLHDWNVDFAAWCSYKYLNAGPGAAAGCFIHERHARNADLPRYAGWWGNDPATRFGMHLNETFVPVPSADAWQVSNPPIFSMAPLRASLDLFDEAGLSGLRGKSERMTTYLRAMIEREHPDWFEIITPRDAEGRGCQLSILVHDRPKERFKALTDAGVVCDFREPNVIRAAPTPLYNTFVDCRTFARVLTGLG